MDFGTVTAIAIPTMVIVGQNFEVRSKVTKLAKKIIVLTKQQASTKDDIQNMRLYISEIMSEGDFEKRLERIGRDIASEVTVYGLTNYVIYVNNNCKELFMDIYKIGWDNLTPKYVKDKFYTTYEQGKQYAKTHLEKGEEFYAGREEILDNRIDYAVKRIMKIARSNKNCKSDKFESFVIEWMIDSLNHATDEYEELIMK